MSLNPPRLFPLPEEPIDRTARTLWREEVMADILSALNVYYHTMPEYQAPPVHHNPRA